MSELDDLIAELSSDPSSESSGSRLGRRQSVMLLEQEANFNAALEDLLQTAAPSRNANADDYPPPASITASKTTVSASRDDNGAVSLTGMSASVTVKKSTAKKESKSDRHKDKKKEKQHKDKHSHSHSHSHSSHSNGSSSKRASAVPPSASPVSTSSRTTVTGVTGAAPASSNSPARVPTAPPPTSSPLPPSPAVVKVERLRLEATTDGSAPQAVKLQTATASVSYTPERSSVYTPERASMYSPGRGSPDGPLSPTSRASIQLGRASAALSTPPPQQRLVRVQEAETAGDSSSGAYLKQIQAIIRGVTRLEAKYDPFACAQCNGAFGNENVLKVGERRYHTDHFFCFACKRNIGSSTYFEKEGRTYCQPCFSQRFLSTCATCSRPITSGEKVRAGESEYHSECFCCAVCRAPLTDYYEKQGRVLCPTHYQQQFGRVCAGCNSPVGTQPSLHALGKDWHTQCFTCSGCRRPVGAGTFYDYRGTPRCVNCGIVA